MTIIFYDIPSTVPGSAWAPSTWKTRFSLNYKGIPYKTEWVEYPDIEGHLKARGIGPTGKNTWDGGDYYSLPAIHDTTTGVYLAESWEIAKYLEKQYPDTPPLFPNGTIGLHATFTEANSNALSPFWTFTPPRILAILNPGSAEYFVKTRTQTFGTDLSEVAPKGEKAIAQWAELKASFDKFDAWFKHSEGPFIMGDTVSWADLNIASYIIFAKIIFGKDSKEWTDISSWNDGRWENLLKVVEKYSAIV